MTWRNSIWWQFHVWYPGHNRWTSHRETRKCLARVRTLPWGIAGAFAFVPAPSTPPRAKAARVAITVGREKPNLVCDGVVGHPLGCQQDYVAFPRQPLRCAPRFGERFPQPLLRRSEGKGDSRIEHAPLQHNSLQIVNNYNGQDSKL